MDYQDLVIRSQRMNPNMYGEVCQEKKAHISTTGTLKIAGMEFNYYAYNNSPLANMVLTDELLDFYAKEFQDTVWKQNGGFFSSWFQEVLSLKMWRCKYGKK